MQSPLFKCKNSNLCVQFMPCRHIPFNIKLNIKDAESTRVEHALLACSWNSVVVRPKAWGTADAGRGSKAWTVAQDHLVFAC